MALSGTTALVGAWRNDDAGSNSGSAYLFDFNDPCNITETKLTASDAAAGDWFGRSVAISGSTAIVGAPFKDDAGFESGSAYLFDVATGVQLFKLTASDAAAWDWFGLPVALSGTTALVGAYRDDDAGTNSGSAYLFDAATGSQIGKLTASDAAARDWFGESVALSGATAIVGALLDDDAGDASGSAYLFDVSDPCNPVQIAKLTASDAAAGDQFGNPVAISGTTALVGANWDDDGGTDSGSAYLFRFCLFPPAGDINLDCRVDFVDLGMMSEDWLFEELSADLWPNGGDGIVNFFDWAIFANQWQITKDIFDLAVFVEQWLGRALSADVWPDGGNLFVDFSDWAVFADAWQSTPASPNWNRRCDIAPAGGDEIVDMDDIVVFMQQWLTAGSYYRHLDADIAPAVDGDGIVNMLDFAALANNWLQGTTP